MLSLFGWGRKIKFDRNAPLGEGGFGSVYRGEFEGRPVAVKRIQLNLVNQNEEDAMRKLNHPNIVKLLYCESDEDFRYYALELCVASLDKLFLKSDDPKKYKGPMPRNIEICRQLAVGLEYIHSKNLTHRDINPENILISVRSTSRGDEVTIKWAGFGQSKTVNERGTYRLSGIRGTYNWLAPESLRWLTNDPQPGVEIRGTVKSDVFVLGLVYGYLFLKGQHLYGNKSDIYQNIVIKKDPVNMHNIDEKLRQVYENDLLRKMLEDDPQKRITSKEVVEQLKSIKKKFFTKLGLDLMAEDNNGWSALYYLRNEDKKEMKIWFDRDAVLGRGGFGAVFKGKFGGREVAVKRVQLLHVDTREEDAMLKLDHPNIVKLLHCEKDNDFMYYALELCVASLDQLFLKSDDPQRYKGPMPRQIEVFSQLASGLEHIHSERLIHRDIKPHNILIMQRPGKNQEIIIKWSDFGLAKSVNEKGLHSWSGPRGTRKWYAPEVLEKLINGEKAEKEEFWGTVKSDVFVLGLVFGYLFLKGEHLYGSSEKKIHENIIGKNPVNMQKINEKLRQYYENDLLRKMLEDDPDKRITSNEVVKQLESIKIKPTEKEKELRRLCERDSSSGLIEKINDLIQLGIDVNATHEYERNALHYLCWFNSNSNLIDAIRLLIQLGIDVNAKDKHGRNALHYLCWFNSSSNLIDAIRLLIQLGIDVNVKDNNGHNALHYFCWFNSNSNLIDAIRLLIQLGIDVNAKDDDGWNALHYLCRNKSNSNLIEAIRLLIQLGIPVVSDGNDARSILRVNYKKGNKEEILKLLDAAARV